MTGSKDATHDITASFRLTTDELTHIRKLAGRVGASFDEYVYIALKNAMIVDNRASNIAANRDYDRGR